LFDRFFGNYECIDNILKIKAGIEPGIQFVGKMGTKRDKFHNWLKNKTGIDITPTIREKNDA
jgi:hypothetical protein